MTTCRASEGPEGWTFAVDEVSAGVYEVRGTSKDGRSVRRKGVDPDELLAECKRDAAELSKRG